LGLRQPHADSIAAALSYAKGARWGPLARRRLRDRLDFAWPMTAQARRRRAAPKSASAARPARPTPGVGPGVASTPLTMIWVSL